jgi:hypothetical protein
MTVQGRDCSIVIKTRYREMGIPCAEETIREAVSILTEEATIEGERFMGDRVTCRINGTEYKNIYGLIISTKKEGGAKTELWVKRALGQGSDLPGVITELTITAQLLRSTYEYRHYGMFRLYHFPYFISHFQFRRLPLSCSLMVRLSRYRVVQFIFCTPFSFP